MEDNGYRLTVTQLNEYVNGMLRGDPLLRDVRVTGELSGFKRHFSGHLYFSLKDGGALVRCVMFRQNACSLDFEPQDGQSVTVRGGVSLYVKDGQYQLYAVSMAREGEGELYRRFMLMKTRLEARGYFAPEHKKPIPRLPRCLGVITSPTGAALQDIINITRRRFPAMNILLYPVRVQGEGAAEEIAAAIAAMNRLGRADVLIVGRGGGSLEDLWPFNEEAVARAIYESGIPVVSAVGHETDFSISDFTADLRAPTPSAAAELCVPEYDRLYSDITSSKAALSDLCRGGLDELRRRIAGARGSAAFSAVRHRLELMRDGLRMLRADMGSAARLRAANAVHDVEKQSSRLDALSPEGVLNRGYGMVRLRGRFVGGIGELSAGDRAELVMRGGSAGITVDSVSKV